MPSSVRVAAVALVSLSLLAGCSGSDDPTSGRGAHEPAEDGDDDREAPTKEPERYLSDPVPGLEDVEIEVVNAAAPYDHDSNVDSIIVESRAADMRTALIEDCLRDEGFTELPPSTEPHANPDRDSPLFMANAEFPDSDRLAREGLPSGAQSGRVDSGGQNDEAEWEPPPGFEEAAIDCVDSLQLAGSDHGSVHPAQEAFHSVRSAWEDELREIDATEEVEDHRKAFAACLREEGVPPESASDERSMLAYVDEMKMAASDQQEADGIGASYGKLYAACGESLFEAKERLRAERRPGFLEEHADAIREISDLVYGGAGRDALE